jgi:hydroxylaminobenzene mutase
MLLRASFFLLLLSLFTGMAIPMFRNPRLGLSAHLTGLMNAGVLIAVAVAWPFLAGSRWSKLLRGLFLFDTYGIWFTNVLGAAWGASRPFPLVSNGITAPAWQELVVSAMVNIIVTIYIFTAAVTVWWLRPNAQP